MSNASMRPTLLLALVLVACSDSGPDPHEWKCDAAFCRQVACLDPDVVQPMHTCTVELQGATLQSVVLEWEGLRGACVEGSYADSPSGYGIYWVDCLDE